MHLGHTAKQIVQITHDVLIRAHHEYAEVIHFAGHNAMQRDRIPHILQIGEL